MLVAVEEILTVGVTTVFTVIFNVFELTDAGEAQPAFEVNVQVTAALFARVVEEYELLLLPTLLPLTCH